MNKYAIAGKELIKGHFGNAIASLVTKTGSSELIQPGRWRNGSFFFGVNGADKAFVWGNYNSSLFAYQRNPVVAAIINKMAQATVNGNQTVMTADKKKEANGVAAKSLKKLLKRPNPYQTGKQFRAQGNIYKRIYGYCPVLKIVPIGFENDFSRWKLFNIPPWMLQVEDSTQMFFESTDSPFKRIRLTYMGRSIDLPLDSVFFLRENQISTSTFMSTSVSENVSLFLPDSKLLTVEKPITNLIDSLISRGSLTRNRGPLWLLTNDSNDSGDAGLFPIKPQDKDELHEDFLQYGIMDGQRKAIITDAKLKLQTVGFDVAQLKLLEGELQDAKMISDGLNYPPYLLGLVDAKFDNQQIAERSLYTNSIIPDADSDDEQWSDALGLDDLELAISTDYSHLPALQENVTEQGRGRWYMDQALLIEFQNDLLTWNEWRARVGADEVAGMDLYYSDLVKSGRIVPAPTAQPAASNVQTDTEAQQSQASGKALNKIMNMLIDVQKTVKEVNVVPTGNNSNNKKPGSNG